MFAELAVGLGELLVVAAAGLYEVGDSGPVAEADAELDGEVLAVDVAVDLLGLVEAAEVGRDFGSLFHAVRERAQPLHELNALVIVAAHEGLVGVLQVQGL